MSEYPRELPLVGLTEIAQRAGVQKQVVAMWRTRHESFPQPVAVLNSGSVFWWPAVEEWLISTGRQSDVNLTRAEVNKGRLNEPNPFTKRT